jgi:hypothetical protein
MLCRKGLRAVVFCAVAAGLLFRAQAAIYPNLSLETFPVAPNDNPIHPPDFSLANYSAPTPALGSNTLPDLLAYVPATDLFTYSSELDAELERATLKTPEVPAWENLWHGAARLPIPAVPEPTSAAILAIGAVVLGFRKNFGGRK